MKSGNLKYGFDISESEFILLLDADFAPRADLLEETLPYFDAFPDVGIVQTPQYFHVVDEQTWVERGAGADPGAVLPVHPDGAGPQGRRDLRRQLRGVPPGGAQPERRHVARPALGGPAHRLRPLPAGLAAALPAGGAVDRELPGQRDGVHEPAVPLVLGHDEPAQGGQVLVDQAAAAQPGLLPGGPGRLRLHGGVHVRRAGPGDRHAAPHPRLPAAQERGLHRPGAVLRGRDLPDVAPVAVPA